MIFVQLTIYLYFSLFVLLFFILFIVRADIIIECLINDKNNNAVFELRLLKGFIKFKIKLPAHTLKKIIGALGKDIDLKKKQIFSINSISCDD
ncbi:MAG: hypothetical protein XD50_0943 [Clostridia bacterium 41_269]|nr:MAG: hypothetical protein XD50_0943 [Clostridia bacterium 41_269]